MPERGISPKETIEGPPARACPILLRQTSFKALEEAIAFPGADGPDSGEMVAGTHTARFGEIEQRGCALTPAGRALYDAALASRDFSALPDDWDALRRGDLAWFRYRATPEGLATRAETADMDALIAASFVVAEPITYEDFLPVSAAGIFQSNLGRRGPPDRLRRRSRPRRLRNRPGPPGPGRDGPVPRRTGRLHRGHAEGAGAGDGGMNHRSSRRKRG